MKYKRNEPCPCGSGKKYKKCCLSKADNPFAPEMDNQAVLLQRWLQNAGPRWASAQGSISKVITVGRLMMTGRWTTFQTFLLQYMKQWLGPEWTADEHPLIELASIVDAELKQLSLQSADLLIGKMSSPARAYLGLAHNIYTVENAFLEWDYISKRLRNKDQFYGAYYELFVMASMIRAGFVLDLQDESVSTSTHCEFTAVYKDGEKYSVEAKMREARNKSPDATSRLHDALRKTAKHKRIVFIELNIDSSETKLDQLSILKQAENHITKDQGYIDADGDSLPPAYVFLTNSPHLKAGMPYQFSGTVVGYKIDGYPTPIAVPHGEEHYAVDQLLRSLREDSAIPIEFPKAR